MPIGDVERLSQLFKTPDVSMRDDYDVAVLEIDTLLDCTSPIGMFSACV